MSIKWDKLSDGTFRVELGDVFLNAIPVTWKNGKPARGTKWRACVSHWDAKTRTMSRYGMDVYATMLETPKEAMHLAEAVYNAAQMPAS